MIDGKNGNGVNAGNGGDASNDSGVVNAVDALLEKGIDFVVSVNNPGILHRIGLLPKERKFVIKPIALGALLRIAQELSSLKVSEEDLRGKSFIDFTMQQIRDNNATMIRIIAIAITNDDKNASRSLIRFLSRNLTPPELLKLLTAVIKQMNLTDFFGCIVSMKGLNVFEATRKQENQESKTAESKTAENISIPGELSAAQ